MRRDKERDRSATAGRTVGPLLFIVMTFIALCFGLFIVFGGSLPTVERSVAAAWRRQPSSLRRRHGKLPVGPSSTLSERRNIRDERLSRMFPVGVPADGKPHPALLMNRPCAPFRRALASPLPTDTARGVAMLPEEKRGFVLTDGWMPTAFPYSGSGCANCA